MGTTLTKAERHLAAGAKWRAANPEKHRANFRAWSAANPEKSRALSRASALAWAKNNPERVRAQRLKRHGLTIEQWETMFEAQGRGCACCGSTDSTAGSGWQVDHNHDTGKIRGILCQPCNLLLGHAHDNPATLAKAIAYLTRTGTTDG